MSDPGVARSSVFAGQDVGIRIWTPTYGLASGILAGAAALAVGARTEVSGSLLLTFILIVALTVGMSFWVVRQERGYIKLTSIATIAAALLLPPPLALAIGATSGLASFHTRPYGIRYMRLALSMFWTTAACVIRVAIGSDGGITSGLLGQVAVVGTITILNWIMTALALSVSQGEPLRFIWRQNISVFWFREFAYFGVAGVLVADVLDGTPRGYGVAILVSILSVALGESAFEHRNRTLLEVHLTDTTRNLAYRRAADGVVHNLRNHLAAARGYIEEVSSAPQSVANRRNLAIASDACRDALLALERMDQASAPRIELKPVDANQAVLASSGLVAGRFGARRVTLRADPKSEPIWFAGDRELIGEVLVNLLLNGLEASQPGGWVRIGVEAKKECVEIRVADNGPGIPEEMRDRLFEPHFTTKPNGTGMGLFTVVSRSSC